MFNELNTHAQRTFISSTPTQIIRVFAVCVCVCDLNSIWRRKQTRHKNFDFFLTFFFLFQHDVRAEALN